MVPAQCPACFHVFQTEDRYAGHAVACHQCGTPTLVPAIASVKLTGGAPPGSVEDATARVVLTLFKFVLFGGLVGVIIILALMLGSFYLK